jgi:hypothetical protein
MKIDDHSYFVSCDFIDSLFALGIKSAGENYIDHFHMEAFLERQICSRFEARKKYYEER